jgi:drug/metabolite transporter (DMT)-like permease
MQRKWTQGYSSAGVLFSGQCTAHFVLVLVQLTFSGWHIIGKVALKEGADPIVFALYRESSASILMISFCLLNNVQKYVEKKDYLRFLFLGCCSFVNVVGAIIVLTLISATRYALFQPIIPCVATVISIAVGVESLTMIKGIGILIAVGGAVVIEAWKTSNGTSEHEANPVLGSLLMIVLIIAFSSIIVFQRPLLANYNPAFVTFVYYTVGTALTMLLCVAWQSRFTSSSFAFDGKLLPWLGIAYAAIFSTAFAYNAYSWASKKLYPTTITAYSTLQPVGTAILSLFVFGEVITLSEIVGGILVMLGLFIMIYGKNESPDDVNQTKYDEEDDDTRYERARSKSGEDDFTLEDDIMNPVISDTISQPGNRIMTSDALTRGSYSRVN